MNRPARIRVWWTVTLLVIAAACCHGAAAAEPTTAPTVAPAAALPAAPNDSFVDPSLVGRRVEEVRITGNVQVSSQLIRSAIRTKEGDPFSPAQVQDDYEHVYQLKRFSNVQAKVEPTRAGVVVIFDVIEQHLVRSIRIVGNRAIETDDLDKSVDIKVGEAIEPFRISLAKKAIVSAYRAKNYPSCHVETDDAALTRTGDLVLNVVEGPKVTIRNVRFIGAKTFSEFRLNREIDTTKWYWIFNSGTYNSDEVDHDVAALRKFYRGRGFFDVKVGRRLTISPDQTEMSVDFLIDEGSRYTVDRVSFVGNTNVPEGVLRKDLKMVPGKVFDAELVELDVKRIVKNYAPLGYIYEPRSTDPNFLRIGKPNYEFVAKLVYHKEPGSVELVYEIAEGKPFHQGRIIIVGNDITRFNVILRQFQNAQPGTLYNSAELADVADRLKALPNFGGQVTVIPIGDQPGIRDVEVEVKEAKTANIGVGAQVNSNLGLAGNISYEQKNFDLFNWPSRPSDLWSGNSFVGNGQNFSASFQPGVRATNGNVSFSDPYIFDQPYSFGTEAHYTQFYREWGDNERRAGGSFTFGKQFDKYWSAAVTFEGEDVDISGIYDYYPAYRREDVINPITHQPEVRGNGSLVTDLRSPRALDVLTHAGHNTLTDVGLTVRRDSTNHGPLKFEGTNTRLGFEEFGALGGQYHYHEFNASFDSYTTVLIDAQDRRTVLDLHVDSDYILNDAPFFNRFYGGGRGSIRGFEFRGVGPRAGRALDPIGGDFQLVGTAELNFPIYGENIRGVVFTDLGTVEPDIEIHTFRQSVGAGVRVVIPFISRVPFAFDVAFPIFKGPQDIQQVFSFGVGI